VLDCTFDAVASNDPDGSIVSYSWDFGDTSIGSGVNPSHTYAFAGAYTVSLTVTDNSGGTNTTTSDITVASLDLPGRVVVSNDPAQPGGGQRTMVPVMIMASFSMMSVAAVTQRRRFSRKTGE
jgi:PKD repeat protein